jgi:hypothetical protein
MKTNVRLSLTWLITGILLLSSALFLTNCKGHVEIFGIVDSVENCSPPFVVYFYPDAEHRTKKLEYTWTFGDGSESHEKEPVHVYDEYGVYEVNLHIRQNKVEQSYSIALYLTEDSTAVFSDWDYATLADDLWSPAYVEFQNYSEHATRFYWEFGDGETSNAKQPVHIYESVGLHKTVLNAICNDDTSKFARDLIIKPPPSDLIVHEVTVWYPDSYLGSDIWVDVWYGGLLEERSVLVEGVTSFPVTFSINEQMLFFDGDFNDDLLEFELWSSINPSEPLRIFGVESRDLQDKFYPTVIAKDDGYGYAYEAILAYRD